MSLLEMCVCMHMCVDYYMKERKMRDMLGITLEYSTKAIF